MPGQNLTRLEAAKRSATVHTRSYDVVLDLTRGETLFRSTTTVRFTATPGASTFIDLIAPTVRSITLNGRALDPTEVYEDSRIALMDLTTDNELIVDADCAYMHTGEGLHRFTDPADGETYLYSQFEVPDSRRVFAVFEQPDLKASFTFTVTTPASWTVLSNSPTPEPTRTRASDGSGEARTFAFAPTEPMSSYVTAIVAGPYVGTTDEYVASDGRSVPLGVYCRKSVVEYMDSEEILDLTKRGFAYYEELFATPYAFTKYDQIFVPEFNAGAMENAGCVTHRDDYIFRSRPVEARVERRAVTILHELAHMWFGDMVTMTWWNDLWLNESFAEFTSTLATAEITRWNQAWTTFQTLEKGWAYNQDQLSSTHPVAAEINDLHDVEVNFDGITYAKGASVLAALVGYVGRDNFFAGIQRYLAAHAYANAELSDLLRELEAVSGRDLSAWTRLWLQEAGATTLRTQVTANADGIITQAAIRQEIPADSPASLRPHRVAIGSYSLTGQGAEARLERTGRIELDVDGELTPVPELVGTRRADILVLNDDDLTYAKVRLDEDSLARGLAHIEAFTESLPRSIVLASAWDMVRDGELAASHFLKAALRALSVEEHSSVIQGLLGRITTCLSGFLPPAVRRDLAPGTADRLLELAQAATAGSDKQLQLVRALSAHAVTDEQLDAITGLLEGTTALDGLDVDQDLRWDLLTGLVAAGRFGEEQIRTEEDRDRTTTGRERAAEARAAVPTPEAKQTTWRALVDDASMPNETQVRVLRGLANVERHPELLEPFVAEYVDVIDSVWSSRTFHMAENLLTGLWSCVTVGLDGADPASALEGWLSSHAEAPAALRRIVRENLDDTWRTARAQAAEISGR
ncbi:aminopeptidase N [Actinomyces sp. oral taxon 849 str. F0330]|uniref:Aminopeptidase N n=1 Tax=Actinomyces johnsonii F0542 TaxID=1321818 RepID=U1Q6L4_9ACTO|nr:MULTISPECIES: aminopeptidase N [Actinomyces]EHM95615.1 aminopeptidase N [Actinomyces sp. oral taxon 849 str. F0330]ERH23490.1 membrane alanyl aminopeptidase [Actinomyces johnsonii F0542]